jgi:1-acyl-sn-glycerol-3-phosphate acyltransferase
MTFLVRLLRSIRPYLALTFFLFFIFPVIMVVISVRNRADSWPFIGKCFRLMLALAGIRFKAEGLEGIDWSRGYMLMGNHVNVLDHFILASIIPTPFVGFEKVENFKVPVYGPMMRKWGNIAIHRGHSDPAAARKVAAEAADLLRQGVGFLVYPEGTRTRTGAIGSFKKGGFHTAVDAGAYILPFTYNGAREVMAAKRWWIKPGLITLTFSPPIDSAAYGKGRIDELVRDTRAAIVGNYHGEGAELPAPSPAETLPS